MTARDLRTGQMLLTAPGRREYVRGLTHGPAMLSGDRVGLLSADQVAVHLNARTLVVAADRRVVAT